MRLLWWRREKRDERPEATASVTSRPSTAATTATLERAPQTLRRVEPIREVADALLRFARDVLLAQGARVRVEGDDLVTATLTDGQMRRYTATPARARADGETQLVVEGSPALAALLDTVASAARVSAIRLPEGEDPVFLALRAAAEAPAGCRRCAGEPAPDGYVMGLCGQCPQRTGRPALRWRGEGRLTAQTIGRRERVTVELTFVVVARDRQGRRDEWVRLAVDAETGERVEPVEEERIARAAATALPAHTADLVERAFATASRELQSRLEATAAFLRQRSLDDYLRRAEDLALTFDRLRREQPEQDRELLAAHRRESAALAEVFAVEAEAQLESVCFVTSEVVDVAVRRGGEGALALRVDAGRGVALPLVCGVCGNAVRAGGVCERGHVICASCAERCSLCGAWRCTACDEAPLATCATCHDHVCAGCARSCGQCGKTQCQDHLWTCAGCERELCLSCAELCATCDQTLCAGHTGHCSACGDALCPGHAISCSRCDARVCNRHTAACRVCATVLCPRHARPCAACGQTVCDADLDTCIGCGRAMCPCAAWGTCATCGGTYCAACQGDNGCAACRSLAAPTADDLAILARAAGQGRELGEARRFRVGHHRDCTVWVAQGLGRQQVYVLAADGTVLHEQRKGLLRR